MSDMVPETEPLASVGMRLRAAARALAELEDEYERSLCDQAVSEAMQLGVDTIVHNQRSLLDYLANRLVEAGTGKAGAKVYYPMQDTETAYEGKLQQNLPGLRAAAPHVEVAIKARQRWQPACEWLGRLNGLRNPNAHVDLLPQTRVEERRSEIRGQGGSVSWGPGVTFGGGVSIGGAPIDPRTQRPAYLPAGTTFNETVYVDWRLPDGSSALASLQEFQRRLEELVEDLAAVGGLKWPV